MRYRKKPVVVEAVRWTGENLKELSRFMGTYNVAHGRIQISTLEGVMEASAGDYVIKGVQGEFYPCKPDIFEATYEPVDPPHHTPGVGREPPILRTDDAAHEEGSR